MINKATIINNIITLFKLTDFKDDIELAKYQDKYYFSGKYDVPRDIQIDYENVKKQLGELPICISNEDMPQFVTECANCWSEDSFTEILESFIDKYGQINSEGLYEIGGTDLKIGYIVEDMGCSGMYYFSRNDFNELEYLHGNNFFPDKKEFEELCNFLEKNKIVDSSFQNNFKEALNEILLKVQENNREIDYETFIDNVKEIVNKSCDSLSFEKTMTGDWRDAINGWDNLISNLIKEINAVDKYKQNNLNTTQKPPKPVRGKVTGKNRVENKTNNSTRSEEIQKNTGHKR